MIDRLFLLLMSVALLAACGGQPAAGQPTSAPAAATSAPAVQPTAGLTGQTSFPLTIKHAQGETTIERPVSRIVAISDETADIVVASGIKPVGIASGRLVGQSGQPITSTSYLDLGQPVFVGDSQAPSLEAVAALKPDLILYLKDTGTDVYTQLSAIAPTIAIDSTPKDYWRPVMTDLGRAAGTETQVAQFLADYDATVKTASERVAPLVKQSPNLALLFLPDASSTFVFDDRSSVSSPYVTLGFTMVAPAGVDIPASGFVQVAAEAVANIKADTIVALRFVDDTGAPLPLPIDTLLGSLRDVRVVTQPLDPSRSSSAPISDKQAIEQAAALLADSSASAPTSPSGVFPVSIKHKYGSTAITQQPVRVVTVGYTDQDAVLALGVAPVGIRDWYGDQPYATWPWAQGKLGDAKPAVLPATLNFEQIAALKPDVIIGISSGMTNDDYATLSKIAPTIAQSGQYIDYGVPWQEQTRVIGAALGRAQEADALVAAVEARFAAARAQHPAFAGASALVAASFNNAYTAYGPQDVRARLLASLGFQTPQAVAELAGESFFASISRERLDVLDTNVLVWVVSTDAEREAIERDPLYQQLNVAREKRAVFLDQQLSGAASFSSVLSLPFLLDKLVPQLAAAIDGDPNTTGKTE